MYLRKIKPSILFPLFLMIVSFCPAQWSNVTAGIDYQQFNFSPPNEDVYVARMSRADTTAFIESSIAGGVYYNTPNETVSGMANRYDGAINWWGQKWGNRNKVIAAINGDYWGTGSDSTGFPQSGQVQSGWFARRYAEYTGGSGFVWTVNRDCFLGGNIRNGTSGSIKQFIQFTNSTATITHVNIPVDPVSDPNTLELFTPQYAPHTYTDNNRVEVLVQMTRPNLMFHQSVPSLALGTVKQILHSGSTYIPFDCVVLSGHGTGSTILMNECSVGQQIGLKMNWEDYGRGYTVPLPSQDWTKAYASVGGALYCVISSQVPSADWSGNPGATNRRARTCIAYNSTYVYFVVEEEANQSGTSGMTITELGTFCRDSLNAEFAIAQDGGGSSALWVNGQIKNTPSDGSERATNNGMMFCLWEPAPFNSTFTTGQLVKTSLAGQIRQGPGSNFPVFTNTTANQSGTILGHPLNGINAKGENWYYWQSGSITGWTSDSQLSDILNVSDWEKLK